MALSMDSKLKDIIKNPEGKAVLQKYFPVDLDAPTMKIAYGMTLRKCVSFPQVDIAEDQLAQLEADILAIGD